MYAADDGFSFRVAHGGPAGDLLDGALAPDAGIFDEDADADAG